MIPHAVPLAWIPKKRNDPVEGSRKDRTARQTASLEYRRDETGELSPIVDRRHL